MRPPRSLSVAGATFLVLVSALVVAASIAPAVAAPPPQSVCGICGSDLESATGPGTLDVRVDESGDSRWTARVPVTDDGVERYRSNPDALESAVEDAWYRYDVAADDARDRELAVADGAVVVNYTVADVARQGVGDAWLLEYFYVGGTNARYDLRAERVSIHAPADHHVTNEPPNARVDGGTVTWTNDGGRTTGRTNVPFAEETYVTYAAGSGFVATAESWATVGATYGPTIAKHATLAGIAPVVLLGLGVVAGRLGRGRLGLESRIGRWLTAPGMVGLERLSSRLGRPFEFRDLIALATAATATVAVVGWLLGGLPTAVLFAAFAAAATLFLPLGYAVERGRTSRWRLAAVLTLAAPLAAVAAFAPYYAWGLGPHAAGLLFVPWALGAVAVGYPLALVGRRIARTKAV